MKEIKILDVKVNNTTMPETIRILENFISLRKSHQIVTLNPEIIISAQKNQEIKNIINSADLVIPDGTGLLWAAKFTKQKLTERITGIDLLENLAELSCKKKYSFYLLTTNFGLTSAKNAAEILQKKYPNLKIAGYTSANPSLKNEKIEYKFPYNIRQTDIKVSKTNIDLKIVENVRKTKPDILFVAYGHPNQELFISRYKKLLNVPVMVGVGGSFDFISGKAKRAPKIFQKFGLNLLGFEWLWRLFNQPWRIKRIFTAVIVFPWKVFIDKITYKK